MKICFEKSIYNQPTHIEIMKTSKNIGNMEYEKMNKIDIIYNIELDYSYEDES